MSLTDKLSKTVGLIGAPQSFIDHIAPICAILNIPLVTNTFESKYYQKYYPNLEVELQQTSLEDLLENYDNLIYPYRWEIPFDTLLRQAQKEYPGKAIFNKRPKLIYTFHGVSDKGYLSSWISPDDNFKEMDLILLNGNRMKDILKDKGVLQIAKNTLIIGNIRYHYYLQNKLFYDQITKQEVLQKVDPKKKTIFYAPSWNDVENSGSFDTAFEYLFKNLTEDYNLVVKLHPHMRLRHNNHDPEAFQEKIKPYLDHPRVTLIQNYPIVYPLLAQADIYIGDCSSVGYDFLTFNKPMFFLNHRELIPYPIRQKTNYLHRCGTVIEKSDFPQIYSIIEKALIEDSEKFSAIRQEMYKYGFDPQLTLDDFKLLLTEELTNIDH